MIISAKFGSIWLNSFAGEDKNVKKLIKDNKQQTDCQLGKILIIIIKKKWIVQPFYICHEINDKEKKEISNNKPIKESFKISVQFILQ